MKTMEIKMTVVIRVPEVADPNDMILDTHSVRMAIYDRSGTRQIPYYLSDIKVGTVTEV